MKIDIHIALAVLSIQAALATKNAYKIIRTYSYYDIKCKYYCNFWIASAFLKFNISTLLENYLLLPSSDIKPIILK